MRNTDQNKGPWFHRFLIRLFTVVITLLIYWALGFMLSDIGSWRGPDYNEIEERMIDASLIETSVRLAKEAADIKRDLEDLNADQVIVRDSLNNSRQTMNEMRETYRLALEQGVSPTAAQQDAQAESEKLFLDNQRRYQQNTERITQITSAKRDLDQQQRDNKTALAGARRPVQIEHERLRRAHNFKVASVKIGVLIPLLALAVWLFITHRGRLYAPLIHAFGIALVVHVGFVMHEYFPAEYFKYILTGIALIVAGYILVHLLRKVAFPDRDWLVKQYREAYEAFLCPVCSYPIRRGPLKFRVWTRRSIRKPQFHATPHHPHHPHHHLHHLHPHPTQPDQDGACDENQPYTCPVCASNLYQACQQCGAIRPTLLPACQHCGDTLTLQPPARQPEETEATA